MRSREQWRQCSLEGKRLINFRADFPSGFSFVSYHYVSEGFFLLRAKNDLLLLFFSAAKLFTDFIREKYMDKILETFISNTI